MTIVFGMVSATPFLHDKEFEAMEAAMLKAASLSGLRSLQTCPTAHGLLGGFAPEGVQCIFSDKKRNYTYIIGGEFFSAPFSRTLPGSLDSEEGHDFLNSIFSTDADRLRMLDGHFCIVRYCYTTLSLRMVNDAMGLYPLYIVQRDRWIAFASEYQVLIELGLPHKLDTQFLADWALYGFSCDGRTPLLDLNSAPPASDIGISFNDGSLTITTSCYDDWDYTIDDSLTLGAAAELLCEHMRHSMYAFLQDGRVPTLPITGGYDSRLMMACLPDTIRQSMQWVTICSPDLSESEDRDVLIAKQICAAFGLPHKVQHLGKKPNILAQSEQQKCLYEPLRPVKLEYGIHGHFSGYLKGLLPDFSALESRREAVFQTYFSSDFCEYNSSRFVPISDNADYGRDENRALKYYLLNNIRCFLNQDHLGGGKWLNPIVFFWQPLRTPFGSAALCRQLLRIPARYRKNGLLFLKIMERLDPRMFNFPFTSQPFPIDCTKHLSSAPVKVQVGTDYQAARPAFWKDMLKQSLLSGRATARGIYSRKWLGQVGARYCMLAGGARLIPTFVQKHWRFQNIVPPMADQHFIKLENWLCNYGDKDDSPLGLTK